MSDHAIPHVAIIAEIGSNHCGSLELALRHIAEATKAGATHVKFQCWDADRLYPEDPGRRERSRPYQLPFDWLPDLQQLAEEIGVQFGLSVFHEEDVETVAPFCDFLKIASLSLRYRELFMEVVNTLLPIYVSTGAADIKAISNAVGYRQFAKLTLMHCVADYPTAKADINLKTMTLLQKTFGYPVGLSDHAHGYWHIPMAIALGATAIEKHFILPDTPAGSPDAHHSMMAEDFAYMVEWIHAAQEVLGSGKKVLTKNEEQLVNWAAQTNTQPYRRRQ